MEKQGLNEGQERLERLRHSASHIMAQAVQHLFPGARFGIGPPIQDGFYYDFDLPRNLTPEDLPAIEEEMGKIVARDYPFLREEASRAEAEKRFAAQPYKLELIRELPDEKMTIYRQGDFVDLCRGPHLASSGQVKAFKLTSIAGAYWRGEEGRPMLQRIYGTAFETKKELEEYLHRLEEASRRDHRRLGRELGLFSIHEEAGPGLIFWHPRGAILRRTIEDFWKEEHLKRGYELVYTPHVARLNLWKTSGHWEHYRENLYSPMDLEGQEYLVKPMNCPGHILIFQSSLRSYRELPIRYAELGTVYRWERSGVLHGLTRVRGFTQDDAHIFCRRDQLEDEVVAVLELARYMLSTFGFSDYQVFLSTRPEKYAGTLEAWEEATEALKQALARLELPYEVSPGEGVFYGPKIDIHLKDALGRAWQASTTQVDFNLPQRFRVSYMGQEGKEQPAVMVHRAILGSLERFLGCLIEHYAGAFPVWLAPLQAVVIPIADRHIPYAQKISSELAQAGLRPQLDDRRERMNYKIREAQNLKVPYMLIIGDEEEKGNAITLRLRSGENLKALTLESFIARAKEVIAQKLRQDF